MTSKEALEELFSGEIISLNSYMNLRLGIIKEDLEVLEILKKSIYNKTESKHSLITEFVVLDLFIKGDDVEKVKEWLENE